MVFDTGINRDLSLFDMYKITFPAAVNIFMIFAFQMTPFRIKFSKFFRGGTVQHTTLTLPQPSHNTDSQLGGSNDGPLPPKQAYRPVGAWVFAGSGVDLVWQKWKTTFKLSIDMGNSNIIRGEYSSIFLW